MGIAPRSGLRSMMIAVASVAVWLGLIARWPALSQLTLLGGPALGAWLRGRDDPYEAIPGGVLGGIVSYQGMCGLHLVALLTGRPDELSLSDFTLSCLVMGSVCGAFVGFVVGVAMSMIMEALAKWRR